MERRKKFFLIGVLVVLSLSLVWSGCGKKETTAVEGEGNTGEVYPENGLPKDKKVTIDAVFPVTGYGREFFNFAIETFQERFPNVTVNVRWFDEGGDVYKQHFDALLQGGNDDEMYDWIYSLNPDLIKRLAESGKLERQDDLWGRALYDTPESKVGDVLLTDRKALEIDGHIYAIPSSSTIYGLYYNKQLFQENGWNEQPQCWDEFVTVCEKIKAKGTNPLVMAGKHPYYFMYGWGAIPHEIGGEAFYDAQYNYEPDVFLSKPYLTMLRRMEAFVKKGYLHPGTVSFDHVQAQMEFVQGEAAFITNATWIANEMKDVTPAGFQWGFMPFPGNDPGQQQVILVGNAQSGFIWKKRPTLQKQWTKEFNLWLLNLDVQLRFAQAGGVPIRKDFVTIGEKDLETISPSVTSALEIVNAEGAKLVDDSVRKRSITNAQMAKLDKVKMDGYIALITGKKTATQVAKEMNNQYKKALAEER